MDKGDLQIADRVLDNTSPTLAQWKRDAEQAVGLGLVEFDYPDRKYIPTQAYIDLMDKLNGGK